QPDLHNQGVMEFGATWCTPRNPKCEECPFRRQCVAYKGGLVEQLPVKRAASPSRKRFFYYLVVERNNALLMRQRQGKDIWHGLFDFALIEKNRPGEAQKVVEGSEYRHWFEAARSVSVSRI